MKLQLSQSGIFILSLFLLAMPQKVSAEDLTVGALDCVISMPKGWTLTFQDPAGFSIASQDRKKTITLLIRNADFTRLDSNSVALIEQDLLKAGCKKISSRVFAINGSPGYEFIQQMGASPFASSFVDHVIIENGKLYDIGAVHIGGDVTQDADVQAGLASFHFLQPLKSSNSSSFRIFDSLTVNFIVLIIIAIGVGF